ncbi:hypothetical protein HYPSUDRAFT_207609 [Hypholoma sublateritium FD-334 SS-4]|uniref:Uncharacterized protein n=1 Tax=Hypholoma sublateritium (strain FD-334 SS-4) TaxID=945553 RepID=A0A0D2N9H5_HYPSF|nr:hypothetical protein HYPSUDRAFT_207609 [Hypholoma sublateritium FD-334 SS-4]
MHTRAPRRHPSYAAPHPPWARARVSAVAAPPARAAEPPPAVAPHTPPHGDPRALFSAARWCMYPPGRAGYARADRRPSILRAPRGASVYVRRGITLGRSSPPPVRPGARADCGAILFMLSLRPHLRGAARRGRLANKARAQAPVSPSNRSASGRSPSRCAWARRTSHLSPTARLNSPTVRPTSLAIHTTAPHPTHPPATTHHVSRRITLAPLPPSSSSSSSPSSCFAPLAARTQHAGRLDQSSTYTPSLPRSLGRQEQGSTAQALRNAHTAPHPTHHA